MTEARYTEDEMMIVAAARMVPDRAVCFVGIGLPSAAVSLARFTHAPEAVLIYESGTIGVTPSVLPLSIGGSELYQSATSVVSIVEAFSYWLQAGRIDLGFLGAAQIDRFANINTTVIGPYDRPRVRLPGGGGAPEIAASSGEILITLRQTPRSFVEKLDFLTSPGHLEGNRSRQALGLRGRGPSAVVTDLGILRPDSRTRELTLVSLHPGVELGRVLDATGWPLEVAASLETTPAPSPLELQTLRELRKRTARFEEDGVLQDS